MAGPVITVAVLADTTKVERGLDNVQDELEDTGQAAKEAGRKVGDGIGAMTEKADESERKFRGVGDTITGTGDIMTSFKDGDVVGLAMGFADLAGGIADFAGPALQGLAVKLGLATAATEVQTEAQVASNAAMTANPIGLVVAALVALAAAFYIAWTKSETFREIVTGAFDAVKGFAEGAVHWIADNWPYLAAILTGPFAPVILAVTVFRDDIGRIIGEIPDKIRAALSTVEGIIKAPFTFAKAAIGTVADEIGGLFSGIGGTITAVIKAPVNAMIDALNAIQIHVHFDTHIPGIGAIGFDWGGLGLHHLALGGIVTGPLLAVVGDNPSRREAVVPLEPGILSYLGGGGTLIVNMPAGLSDRAAWDAVERYRRRQGLAS